MAVSIEKFRFPTLYLKTTLKKMVVSMKIFEVENIF